MSEHATQPADGALFERKRHEMVEKQLVARGIADERVLAAMRAVPRERFVPEDLREFAYDDGPLPIPEGQTISQPYIVALMAEALALGPGERVLEVGAGSGYAAAVMGQIAEDVYAVERHPLLARLAGERMAALEYRNVHVIEGDGSLGLPEHAPYDAIAVAASGPELAGPLVRQLKAGGRLVMPVGPHPRSQELIRLTRTEDGSFARESLGRVQFVPLIGREGWPDRGNPAGNPLSRSRTKPTRKLRGKAGGGKAPGGTVRTERERSQARDEVFPLSSDLVRQASEPIDDIDTVDLSRLLERIGGARVVLIGEATHGTSEFYRMRARITRELIETRGFEIVAIEGDWPDVSVIDRHVRGRAPLDRQPFARFPSWMWRNREVAEFVAWLRWHNEHMRTRANRVRVCGLDLYSLYESIGAVLGYLDERDAEAAEEARGRYACFTPWETDPAAYGRAASRGRLRACAGDAVRVLQSLLAQRLELGQSGDGDEFFDAERNATLVREAERYYRVMYEGTRLSWNLRDRHMFQTLRSVLDHHGPDSKAVVWAHNSHVGDASATEMGARGEFNIGQLARETFGESAYIIGQGMDRGEVSAAEQWDGPEQIMEVPPARPDSYERVCLDSGAGGAGDSEHGEGGRAFLLPLRSPAELRAALGPPRLQRAIGVVYRPRAELQSHYFQTSLPRQFDEYVWFEETRAVASLEGAAAGGVPETYPFGV